MVRLCECPVRVGLQRQDDDEPALRGGIIEAARIGDERPTDPGGAIDCRGIAIERVQVDRVIHISGKSAHDVGGGVVRKHRLPRGVVDVEDIVDRLEDEAVPGAQSLIGRLDRKLVPAPSVALLVEVQTLEADVHVRI